MTALSPTVELFLLALLGSMIALVGGVIFLTSDRLASLLEKYSVPFAAGVLVTVSLLGLFPEAIDLIGEKAFPIALVAFLMAFFFETTPFNLHHHDSRHKHKKNEFESAVMLVIMGDTIHNLIDGVAIAASYLVAPGLGLITALSTLLHEVPHEIGDFGILLRAGWKKKNVLMVNVVSASFTFIGAFSVYLISSSDGFVGTLLAISAGLFLYLGASDFLPHIDEEFENPVHAMIPLVIGVAVMSAVLYMVPHTDEHVEEDVKQLEEGTNREEKITDENPITIDL